MYYCKSQVNSSKSNHPNTINSDKVIGNSNLSNLNVQTESSFNTLINLQTETDTKSNISTNNENFDENNIIEEIPSHQNSAELVDHICDGNGICLLNYEEEADITSIHYINAIIDIYINDDENVIHKYYAPFLSSKIRVDASFGSEHDSAK